MRLSKFIPFVALFCTPVWAEPYLSPNDPFIRHEIRLLGDERGLNGLQNTWPLDLGGLSSMRIDSGNELPHSLLDDKISTESRSGWQKRLHIPLQLVL